LRIGVWHEIVVSINDPFSLHTMKKAPKNPNDHRRVTPSTKGSNDDRKFTSYDTRREETSTPQKVREGNESTAEQARLKKARTKPS